MKYHIIVPWMFWKALPFTSIEHETGPRIIHKFVFKAKGVRRDISENLPKFMRHPGTWGTAQLPWKQENLHCLCILISIYCIFSSCYLVCGFLSQNSQDEDSVMHGSTGKWILQANWKQMKAYDSFWELHKPETCFIGSRSWTPLVSMGNLVMVKGLDRAFQMKHSLGLF